MNRGPAAAHGRPIRLNAVSSPLAIVPRTDPPPREAVLAGAVDLARAAAEADAPGLVGDHRGYIVEGPRALTHVFDSLKPGYRGWYWAVSLSRPPRGRRATVNEVSLLPGIDAVLAPPWVPWSQRLEPSDVGPTDVLPYDEHDERLEAGFEATGKDADQLGPEIAYEVGLGRARVLSAEGRRDAAQRWYTGKHGPRAKTAQASRGQCSTCAFFLPLAGSMRTVFGVCANEWSPSDGSVVSVDHGCGAHSETGQRPTRSEWTPPPPVVDELDLEVIEHRPVGPEIVAESPST